MDTALIMLKRIYDNMTPEQLKRLRKQKQDLYKLYDNKIQESPSEKQDEFPINGNKHKFLLVDEYSCIINR